MSKMKNRISDCVVWRVLKGDLSQCQAADTMNYFNLDFQYRSVHPKFLFFFRIDEKIDLHIVVYYYLRKHIKYQ